MQSKKKKRMINRKQTYHAFQFLDLLLVTSGLRSLKVHLQMNLASQFGSSLPYGGDTGAAKYSGASWDNDDWYLGWYLQTAQKNGNSSFSCFKTWIKH